MNFFVKYAVLILFFLAILNIISAQPVLTGIKQNEALVKAAKINGSSATKNETQTLKLPFFDDFSYGGLYPSANKWKDRQGFVNNGFAIMPPSQGVVTLDALDENGKIYSHATSAPFGADTLTSQNIRLDSIFNPYRKISIQDSIYFSFYFQPGGGKLLSDPQWGRIGDQPETDDRLILEFGYFTGDSAFAGYTYVPMVADSNYYQGDTIENPFITGMYFIFDSFVLEGDTFLMPKDSLFKPLYTWNEVWSTNGCSLDNFLAENSLQYFKQVLVPVKDEQYLRNNFQFRFRNFASLDDQNHPARASNVDQWNIDYVKLDINRSFNDFYPNDVVFVKPTTSLLKDYYAMPWKQFIASRDVAQNFNNALANISSGEKNSYYHYIITDNSNSVVGSIYSNNENALPYYPNGLHNVPYHATPVINFNPAYNNNDSALFTITHVFEIVGSEDVCHRNDTSIFKQQFYNYYAYDDGNAEAGLFLQPVQTNQNSSLAVKFTLNHPDTLRAVRMWFNDVLNGANQNYFEIRVWDNNGGVPGNVIYSQSELLPGYANDFAGFYTYFLNNPVAVEGIIFIGFFQNHDTELNIGFDQNFRRNNIAFTNTNGNWEQLFFLGAPMIRAVVGKEFGVNVNQTNKSVSVTTYPNPTNGSFKINSSIEASNIEIYDLCGRCLLSKAYNNNEVIDLSQYQSGLYIMLLKNNNVVAGSSKIVKQ